MTTVQSSSNTVTSASTTATRRGGVFGLFHRKKKTKRKSTEKESPGARSALVSSPRRNNNKNVQSSGLGGNVTRDRTVIKRKDVGGHSPSHGRRFLIDDPNGTVPSTTKAGSSAIKKDDRMTSQSREDKVDAMKKSKAVKQIENAKGGKSLFSRSKRFQKMVDNVFVSIDTDGSGEIDKKELYAGLILIHLRLAAYVGPAACRPATKEYVEEIFDLLDADGSGQLSREEFGTVMAVLLSQITSRIVLYMIFPLVIIPLLARFLMDGISWGLVEWNRRMYGVSIPIPSGIQEVTSAVVEKMHDMVPADLWEKIPMTLISTMLGMLVLPWAIFQLDAFFNKLAASSKKNKKLHAGAEESLGRQEKKTT